MMLCDLHLHETGIGIALGTITLSLATGVYWLRKRKLACLKGHFRADRDIENFISDNMLLARRFTYAGIKRMTNSFSEKLGQGGFGSVYKGKPSDSTIVAAKLWDSTKGSGQEFINEVAGISRTSHVNIVTLLGFCFEGRKRAVIYEFMPNGSLDWFIHNENAQSDMRLGWEKLYQIAVGIARGLEYLHRGCNTRILHFDIKPHNILLDKEFHSKISDFGLSKLCLERESTVSMVVARGTIGYIASEVFSRNFGRVSYKSDVYSYGKMLIEMIVGSNNLNAGSEQSNEIYFSDWVYRLVEQGYDWDLHGELQEEEVEMARKMALVGLWCIQTNPTQRPSMSRVIEMLEGTIDSLQIPPKPFLFTPHRSPIDSSLSALVSL